MSSIDLAKLFPIPTKALAESFPQRLPGISVESGEALVDTLKEDFIKYHVFFDDFGRHNHTAHHLVALYALGADSALIRAGLVENAKVQVPAFDSPGSINEDNVFDHLGDRKYYQGYLRFFIDQVNKKGIAAALEDYIFSDRANGLANTQEQSPAMLVRFMDSIVHPMIHTGYGCEFNMPGLIAEGLAQTAVHCVDDAVLLGPSVFQSPNSTNTLSTKLSSISISAKEKNSGSHGTHALTVLSKAFNDPLLAPETPDHHGNLPELRDNDERAKARLQRVLDLSEKWASTIDCNQAGLLEAKIEELATMNTLIYLMRGAHAGDGQPFYADFFLAHLVTSSMFLAPITHFLNPVSQGRLLKAYFSMSLAWYIVRGRRHCDIARLFTSRLPTIPSSVPLPHGALVTHSNSNPWMAIVNSGIPHPEVHVCKLARALMHWAIQYAHRPAGYLAALVHGPDGLNGADKIDGSLFARAALLSMSKLGWIGQGESVGAWDIFITGFEA